jgi:hypothetical protein
LPPRHASNRKSKASQTLKKTLEIRDTEERAATLERKTLAAALAREELECEARVATRDALRLRSSTLPSLRAEVHEAERELSQTR